MRFPLIYGTSLVKFICVPSAISILPPEIISPFTVSVSTVVMDRLPPACIAIALAELLSAVTEILALEAAVIFISPPDTIPRASPSEACTSIVPTRKSSITPTDSTPVAVVPFTTIFPE